MNALNLLVRGGRGAAGIPSHPATAQAQIRAGVEADPAALDLSELH